MPSSAENDERVMTLAAAALRLPAAERAEFLRVTCKDPDLYREVVHVVEWEERMGDFLRQPLVDFIDLEDQEKPEQPFAPNQSLSERFVILSEVGRGGMGVVYEAFDRKRNQRIAIKCARAGFGRLLSPELEGALKVRHPNICLVNEIHTAPTTRGNRDFLTMEYLEGETLAARLARDGRIKEEDALEIARQLCAGLAAAHQAGILHRDLKSGNVILTHADDGSARAVITDFGLATNARADSELDGGTPRYMAPELWVGGKPGKASDVYALGVILYEMITGRAPLQAHDATGASAQPPVPPTRLNKDLDACWDEAILPCLESAPTARPEADQVLAVFDQRPWWKSPLLAVAVLALVALLAAFQQPLMKLFRPADIRLAILPVQASADFEQLGNGVLQDVVRRMNQFQNGESTVTVIPLAEVSENGVHTPEQARSILHATHLLNLRLRREGGEIVADEALVELTHGTHLLDRSWRYAPVTIGRLSSVLTDTVSEGLHLHHASAPDTVSQEAATPYVQGLYFLRRDENSFDQAIPLFQEAARRDPPSPLPLAGLAEAELMKYWSTRDGKWLDAARQTTRTAEALNPGSPAVLLVSGRIEANSAQYEAALGQYRKVLDREPRNIEVLLRMAALYDRLDMRKEAIDSYQNAIAADRNYYRPYHQFGVFFYHRGEYRQAAEQFQNAITRAPGLYDAFTNLGAAYSDMGRYNDAVKAFDSSLALRETARALNGMGATKAYQRRDAEAISYYNRAALLDPSDYFCLLNAADSHRRLGSVGDAQALYRKAMGLASAQLQDNPRDGYTRAFVAYFALMLGDNKRAEDEIEQALRLSPTDNKVLRRAVLIYEMLGQRNRAIEIASGATGQVLLELDRHPDLADFRQDSRFRQLIVNSENGGR